MEAMINKTLEQLRALYGISGGILVAVKDGKCILKHCFGEADAEQHRPVDSKTLFQIASCSKALKKFLPLMLDMASWIGKSVLTSGWLSWSGPISAM